MGWTPPGWQQGAPYNPLLDASGGMPPGLAGLGTVTNNSDLSGSNSSWQQAHSNPTGGQTWEPVQYGGYAGGYGDTHAWLAHLQQQALSQKSPTANFGQANAYMGDQYQTALSENQNLAAMRSQLGQLEAQAAGMGGPTAADKALMQGVQTGQSAAQSLAGRAAPGAAWSGAQRESAGVQSQQAAQGQSALTQQKYGEQMAAQGELGQAQSAYQSALAGARGGALGAASQYGQQAMFNPGLAEQQAALSAEAGYQGESNLLGLNATQQAAAIQQQQNEWSYGLAEQGYGMQANALANSAFMGGASGGLSALGMAIQNNPQPQPSYSPSIANGTLNPNPY